MSKYILIVASIFLLVIYPFVIPYLSTLQDGIDLDSKRQCDRQIELACLQYLGGVGEYIIGTYQVMNNLTRENKVEIIAKVYQQVFSKCLEESRCI